MLQSNEKITALYCRLSQEDELAGESGQYSAPKADTDRICRKERFPQSKDMGRRWIQRCDL